MHAISLGGTIVWGEGQIDLKLIPDLLKLLIEIAFLSQHVMVKIVEFWLSFTYCFSYHRWICIVIYNNQNSVCFLWLQIAHSIRYGQTLQACFGHSPIQRELSFVSMKLWDQVKLGHWFLKETTGSLMTSTRIQLMVRKIVGEVCNKPVMLMGFKIPCDVM